MFNKKLKFFLIIFILTFGIIGAYFILNGKTAKESHLQMFNYKVFNSSQEIFDASELVVLATVTKNSKEIILEGEYLDGYTLTDIEIIEILKDENKLLDSQSTTIVEPTFSKDNGLTKLGRTQFYFEGYRKAVPDSNYIFFLSWDPKKEAYGVNALHQGKINVDGKDIKEAKIAEENPVFDRLKKDVLKNYYIQS